MDSCKITISAKAIPAPVAERALFYLLKSIDFIPDHIPLFGFMDDFLILGLAAGYYSQKLKANPSLF